jgi:diguanylate cyclase (GGDEF)-like protein
LSTAVRIAERHRAAVAATRYAGGAAAMPELVTVSIGVSAHNPAQPNEDSPDGLLRRADQALYAAKRSGRDRVMTSEAA